MHITYVTQVCDDSKEPKCVSMIKQILSHSYSISIIRQTDQTSLFALLLFFSPVITTESELSSSSPSGFRKVKLTSKPAVFLRHSNLYAQVIQMTIPRFLK